MMSSNLTIQKFMTFVPKSISFDASIAQAHEFMRKLRVRHLPVLKNGKIVGLLSDRDVSLVLSFTDIDPEKTKVEMACSFHPYLVGPETSLDDVLAEMVERKISCALIVENGKLLGIFTEIDACKALREFLAPERKNIE
jgi:acetoin utilization protein AcuB